MNEAIHKITLADLARELHLTPSTVCRALNDHPAISPATKQAVRQLAQLRQYQPNRIASSLRLGKSRVLGVLIPSAEINFFGSVVHGIEKVARKNDYNVLIYQSNEEEETERRGINTFMLSRVGGVIASLSKETLHLHHFQELKRSGIPLVLVDRVSDSLGVPAVVIDDYKGAFKATTHLLEQGCRRVAHIAGQQQAAPFSKRLKGYVDALKKFGLPVQEDLIVYSQVTVESGRECMNHLLWLSQPPDAVFAAEDFTALGAIQALKAAHKNIPNDVAIVGFANEDFGQYITPALSTVDQQPTLMGEAAAELFFQLSAKDNFYRKKPVKKILEPVLICRASSQKRFKKPG